MRPFNFLFVERTNFSHIPDHEPRIIVARVGMKDERTQGP
jgi:hypothetical protein